MLGHPGFLLLIPGKLLGTYEYAVPGCTLLSKISTTGSSNSFPIVMNQGIDIPVYTVDASGRREILNIHSAT